MNHYNLLSDKRITVKCNQALDLLLPPIISDRRSVACIFNFLQGRGFRYIDVKKDPAAFPRGKRDSDFTPTQRSAILDLIVGERVLDIGCGTGSLVKLAAEKGFMVTGVDPGSKPGGENNWRILRGYVENSGFQAQAFDTVLSLKTLEHIPDARSALEFWRTLAKRRIILLLPCQRYRRFGFDGHVNFYPDEYQLRIQLRLNDNASITKVDNEWLVFENIR